MRHTEPATREQEVRVDRIVAGAHVGPIEQAADHVDDEGQCDHEPRGSGADRRWPSWMCANDFGPKPSRPNANSIRPEVAAVAMWQPNAATVAVKMMRSENHWPM